VGSVVGVEPDRVTPIRGAIARGRARDHCEQPLGRGALPATQRLQARRDLHRQRVALAIEGAHARSYRASRFRRTASSARTVFT
jgi:hypothetical protein